MLDDIKLLLILAPVALVVVWWVRFLQYKEESNRLGDKYPTDSNFDNSTTYSNFDDSTTYINPSTGCPMVGGLGGIDTSGHTWGN